ncbi:amino acid permease [Paenibacillus sp. JX-17]|uniref:Amino acid permease n=1 Tax=Paenibacillus lacisoli TaxID=3064525 RepID=A0ABT9C6G5_9BACL|nr:amino acid permease [Paenibacillus sp. JX-17]MDO7904851.1 amino acid permease [Paenibacillus sp. JX-17]
MAKSTAAKEDTQLQWWQLSLLGVACTIGTGYFLGTGLGIRIGGPSILIAFVLAALGTYIVFDVLAQMTAKEPEQGSFRSYAKKAFGRWAGFSSGWVYWSSELLIMGSQLTALSLFTRFWLPGLPLWLLACGYAILGLAVLFMGTKGFDRVENVLAVIKIAAIVMFLVIAVIALLGWVGGGKHSPSFPTTAKEFFPASWKGSWSSVIFAFYAFGGIEIIGLMAIRLKNPADAPKAGKMMLILLASVYIISVGLAVTLLPWSAFTGKESPFIAALKSYDLPFVPHVFNAVLIIAGFSTMVASLFAVTTMLVTLAGDGDAPKLFAIKVRKKLALPAIALTAAGMAASIVLALLIPGKIYEYVTTAAGLLLLYNWLFILITAGKLLQLTPFGQIKRYAGMVLILIGVTGTLFHGMSRPGFWISLLFIGLIGIVTLLMQWKWKKQKGGAALHRPLKKRKIVNQRT